MDGEIGSLTPGKKADLIMVDTRAINLGMFADDPAHLLVEAARPHNVDTVLVDGRILKRHGKLTAVDADQVVREAAQSMREIDRRVSA
jgi:cytosine/adenosine deaminase-related metal-dependent hydrolase